MASKSYRKALKSYNFDVTTDTVSVLYSGQEHPRYIRVDLTDNTELDRRVELNLSLEDAHVLAHRLLQRVEAAENANARDAARQAAKNA